MEAASELEAAVRAPSVDDFLHRMYGNEPDLWSDDLHGAARLRFITNAFTRMRFVDRRGRLDPDGQPGFALLDRHRQLGARHHVERAPAAGCLVGGPPQRLDGSLGAVDTDDHPAPACGHVTAPR